MADGGNIRVETVQTAVGGESFIVDEATDEVLRLHLDQFEGPFEVLLYLIKSQEIDIFDIPIVKITDQYLRFLDMMQEMWGDNLDVAGEFLVMAATLIQIKSKMLLPVEMDSEDDEEEVEEDPRLELVEKLLEYRRYRDITERLDELMRLREDLFSRMTKPVIETVEDEEEFTEVGVYDLIQAFRNVLRYINDGLLHTVTAEGASVDEKIALIEDALSEHGSVSWLDLFRQCKSRVEMVCCFLAILELGRMRKIRVNQSRSFGDIRVFPAEPTPEPDVVPA